MTLLLRFGALALLTGLVFAAQHQAVYAKSRGACATLRALDTNKDGTADLNEAKQAASALFDKLDTDKDGTLTTKELQGRVSRKDLTAADPDKDATLSKDEYLALVETRFKAADTNGEGTIDCDEAKTAAGHALLRLLK